MSLFEIERLTRENKTLNDTIREQLRKISTLQNNCYTFQEISKKSVREKEELYKQIKDLKRRIEEQKYEREEVENRYFNVLRKLEEQIEDRKKKYQKLQSKIEPLIDHDTVRLKILNEVESVHFMELDEEKRKVNTLKDQVLRLKRELQFAKHKLETEKIDHEDQMRKLKLWAEQTRSQDHFNSVTYEVCADVENRLRLNYEQARKQSQYYKQKYFSSEKKNYQKMANLQKQLQILKERQAIIGK